jgi:hypothetical protein
MNTKTLFVSTIALTLIGSEIVPQIAQAEPALTIESRLGTNGIGPVHVGMTASEAQAAAGRKIIIQEIFINSRCTNGTFRGLDGVSVMLINGIIERVDVINPEILSLRGAAIGDSESRIRKLYSGQIEATRHPYTGRNGGKYLTFYPKDQEDRDYRLIFETYNGKVKTYRGGRVPAVEAIEGCA